MRRLDHGEADTTELERNVQQQLIDSTPTIGEATCMHAYHRVVFFFSKAVETGINLSGLVLLPKELKTAASIGVLDALTVALSL